MDDGTIEQTNERAAICGRQDDENFVALLNVITDVAFIIDTNGVILYANQNTARLLETTYKNLFRNTVFHFVPRSLAKRIRHKIDTAIRSGKPVRFENRLKNKIFDNNIYPILDRDGNTTRLAVYIRNITKRRHVEAILQQTEEQYRKIWQNATEGIFQVAPEGHFISANPSLARIHGYDSPDELISSILDIAHQLYANPDDRFRLMKLLNKNGSVQNFEVQMRRKDGSLHWISINIQVVRNKEGKVLYNEGTMQDITERKQAEAALAESEERYRVAIEHSNDGVAIIRGDKNLYVNRRFIEMFGYAKSDELIGKSVTTVVHPDDKQKVTHINILRQKEEPTPSRYEFKGITKNEHIIFIEVSATNITYLGGPAYLLYMRDITERKKAEDAMIQSHQELERLNRAKTKAVNHISHELKTPLAVIIGNIRVLKRKLKGINPDNKLMGTFNILERNVERLFEIQKETDQIFRFSRELEADAMLNELDRLWERLEEFSNVPADIQYHMKSIKQWINQYITTGEITFQSIDLNIFVRFLIEKIKRHAAHRNIEFIVEGENDLYIFMDPGILKDVLDGLLKNAVENTPDGGKITVTFEEKNHFIWIHVTDTGVGITEENQAYLFDGLFHTEETELYASRKPYDFGAGGKGLDLLRMKVYAKRFGFELQVKSSRCKYIPTNQDLCPGSISLCNFCESEQDCYDSGGTTFSIAFPSKENT